MSKSKKESLRKVENDAPTLTPEQHKERITNIINEAHFRFKCCEIASKYASSQEEMFTLANDVYSYSFHIPKEQKEE
jgi:hypothetical protein